MEDDKLTMEEFRSELLKLLARSVPFDEPNIDRDDIPEAGIPTAALIVVEWQASDGYRWLSRMGTLANGQGAPRWTLEMLAREALTWDVKATNEEL